MTDPITYLGGGSLGDFFHQLSVVKETFLNTGRQGRVYISDRGYPFGLGLDRAYADLTTIVSSQDYVESFHIHGDEHIDVDLSSWRQSPLLYRENWHAIFESTFHVPWGLHKWLTLPASGYKDTILIGLSTRRLPTVDWSFLQRLPGHALFVTDRQDELDNWRTMTSSDLPTKIFPSLFDLHCAIHACRLFIGNLSSPLAVAMSAHRPCIGLRCHEIDDVHVTGLTPHLPHFQLADRDPIFP